MVSVFFIYVLCYANKLLLLLLLLLLTTMNSATDRRGYVFEHRFTKFSEITQCNGHYAVQDHSISPILVPIESSHTTSYPTFSSSNIFYNSVFKRCLNTVDWSLLSKMFTLK